MRPERFVHYIHTPEDDDGGKQGEHVLVKQGVFDVMIVASNKDGKGNDAKQQNNLSMLRLSMREDHEE